MKKTTFLILMIIANYVAKAQNSDTIKQKIRRHPIGISISGNFEKYYVGEGTKYQNYDKPKLPKYFNYGYNYGVVF